MKKEHEVTVRDREPVAVHDDIPEVIVAPAADVMETQEAYLIMMDMPGSTKDDIAVRVDQGTLHVRGRVAAHHRSAGQVLYKEVHATGYERSFTLGEGVDTEGIDARYEHGVLTLTLRKSERARPKQITIQ